MAAPANLGVDTDSERAVGDPAVRSRVADLGMDTFSREPQTPFGRDGEGQC